MIELDEHYSITVRRSGIQIYKETKEYNKKKTLAPANHNFSSSATLITTAPTPGPLAQVLCASGT